MVGPSPDPAYIAAMITSFSIDASTRELHGPAGRVRVERHVVRLAAVLLRTPGQVVTYAAITAAMWPPPAVPPAQAMKGVRAAAGKLRAALGAVGAAERLKVLYGSGMLIAGLPPREHDGPATPAAALGLTLDPATMAVRHGHREVDLAPQAVTILRTLLSGAGLATRTELLAAMYPTGETRTGAERVLRVKLAQLRRKLHAAGVPVRITHVPGIGYRLRAEVPPVSGS